MFYLHTINYCSFEVLLTWGRRKLTWIKGTGMGGVLGRWTQETQVAEEGTRDGEKRVGCGEPTQGVLMRRFLSRSFTWNPASVPGGLSEKPCGIFSGLSLSGPRELEHVVVPKGMTPRRRRDSLHVDWRGGNNLWWGENVWVHQGVSHTCGMTSAPGTAMVTWRCLHELRLGMSTTTFHRGWE